LSGRSHSHCQALALRLGGGGGTDWPGFYRQVPAALSEQKIQNFKKLQVDTMLYSRIPVREVCQQFEFTGSRQIRFSVPVSDPKNSCSEWVSKWKRGRAGPGTHIPRTRRAELGRFLRRGANEDPISAHWASSAAGM
jgi:hypothetical protein